MKTTTTTTTTQTYSNADILKCLQQKEPRYVATESVTETELNKVADTRRENEKKAKTEEY